jgi:hypothetical protein
MNGPTYPDIAHGNAVRPGARCQTRGGDTEESKPTGHLGLSATPSIGLLEKYSALSAQTAWNGDADL